MLSLRVSLRLKASILKRCGPAQPAPEQLHLHTGSLKSQWELIVPLQIPGIPGTTRTDSPPPHQTSWNPAVRQHSCCTAGCSHLALGPESPHEHKDPTKQYFWYPPHIGPWNQNVRSFCLCGLWGCIIACFKV